MLTDPLVHPWFLPLTLHEVPLHLPHSTARPVRISSALTAASLAPTEPSAGRALAMAVVAASVIRKEAKNFMMVRVVIEMYKMR